MVECPICGRPVKQANINAHLDSGCKVLIGDPSTTSSQGRGSPASFFATPAAKQTQLKNGIEPDTTASQTNRHNTAVKRAREDTQLQRDDPHTDIEHGETRNEPVPKKPKTNALQKVAPLAERMRPKTLGEVQGQELVGENGVLRGLIEQDRVPSMILWGGAGTGKTTIARVIANMVGSRFVEINSTNSGVGDCKKIFVEAKSELSLTGRKTILFCDEIHRFSKSQQDVFLAPVEAGIVTLIGATTENPSFKVQNALLSRCRTFTLNKLTDENIIAILSRALEETRSTYNPGPLVNPDLLAYLAAFSDGDARTSLNLLELAMSLSQRPNMSTTQLKSSLTQTLVYDRSGDQHYDTISAFHKSVRGSSPDAALYYLARMLQSGEDALYIARRLVVIASEDIGLADNSMLSLAAATYTACEKIGMPECRINLAHCTVAFCLSGKSTRAYRALGGAFASLKEPGVAGLPVPVHLRNAPTRLMRELGYGREYKYNPNYRDGKVRQEYLPEQLKGRTFLEENDLGDQIDEELSDDGGEEDMGSSESRHTTNGNNSSNTNGFKPSLDLTHTTMKRHDFGGPIKATPGVGMVLDVFSDLAPTPMVTAGTSDDEQELDGSGSLQYSSG